MKKVLLLMTALTLLALALAACEEIGRAHI